MTIKNWTINVPKLDWITLTSHSKQWYEVCKRVRDDNSSVFGEAVKRSRFENYTGLRSEGGWFIGEGWQVDGAHYLMSISGELADDLRWLKSGLEVDGVDRLRIAKCTRLDMQITIPIDSPEQWCAYDVVDVWRRNGLANARLVEGGDGMDTIYIGKRTTGHMWRVYVKEDGEGRRYLRWELELRKRDNHSIAAWEALNDGVTVADIMSEYRPNRAKLITENMYTDRLVRSFLAATNGNYDKPKRVRSRDFMYWLNTQVVAAIMNRRNTHEYHEKIEEWLSIMVENFGGECYFPTETGTDG